MDRGWRTVVCVASGPSLTDADCALVHDARLARACHVIVVNDNWRKVSSADVLYGCDPRWWNTHHAAISFAGERWTQVSRPCRCAEGPGRMLCEHCTARTLGLRTVELRRKPGLCRETGVVHGGDNSGYQAINLAYHFGAKRIVLLGYDMMRGPNDEKHWFGSHPDGLTNGDPAYWIGNFDALARDFVTEGVSVVNATRRTALTCFPRMSLADALAA